MADPLHTVVETSAYLAAAKRVGLTDEDRTAIVDQVAADPTDGDVVRGSGGVRKVRFAGSGGFRVMAAYLGIDVPVFLLSVLAKGQRANFSDAEVAAMRAATKAIKQKAKERG